MALILNIESATTNCSVSLSEGDQIHCLKEEAQKGYSHGEQLHSFIDHLFRETGYSPNALDAVAVSKGPGSYTGLRIGVSAAKGLCYALDKPLIAVSTLESLARQVGPSSRSSIIIPMLDARRLEVYSAVFNGDYELLRSIEAELLTPTMYEHYLKAAEELIFIGNAVEKTEATLPDHPAIRYIYALPSAKEMASISDRKYKKSDVENVAYFEPYYLKDFIAIKPKPLF
jgi:tRNA threonylcarbamoyladenosine biosynthesis protein TsaB